MTSKKDNPPSQNNTGLKKDSNVPITPGIKMREDTIPVIVVNGVYYPSQKLRFKLNDP